MLPGSGKRNFKALRSILLSIKTGQLPSYLTSPIFLVFISYITGILSEIYLENNIYILFSLCITTFFIIIISYKIKLPITTTCILLFFLLFGMINTYYQLTPREANHIFYFSGKNGKLTGTIYQIEERRDKYYNEIYVDTDYFLSENNYFKTRGRVLLRVYDKNIVFKYGDKIEAETVLKKPDLPGNFGAFNYRQYLIRKKIYIIGNIYQDQIKVIGSSNKVNLFAVIKNIRSKISQKIDAIYDIPAKALVKAIITGERDEISNELIKVFQDAGIIHILAISGLHVGILASIIYFILKIIPERLIKRNIRFIIMIVLLVGFAIMTGLRPSVSRATLMFIIILGANIFNRPYHVYNSLILTAIIILFFQPLLLFDAGFLLSFVVTFFIIFLSPVIENKIYFMPEYVSKPLSVSVAAWLGSIPLTAYFFYQVSIISILANIIVIPFISIILIIALATILFSFLPLSMITSFLALLNESLISVFLFIGRIFSTMPISYKNIAQPEIFMIILYYMVVIVFFYAASLWSEYNTHEKKNMFWLIATMLWIFSIFILFPYPKLLEVHFINVGQGDCIYVKTPDDKNIIIDGGGTPYDDYDVGLNVLLPYLRRKGIREIDLMVLTHPDLDHLEGLIPVLEEMRVMTVIERKVEYNNEVYNKFHSQIQESDYTEYYNVKAGDYIRLSDETELFILYPPKKIDFIDKNNFNNYSIVLKLRYKKIDFLFTGDIEKAAEINLLSYWNDFLKSDILKVAHHGSKSSSSELFIEKVQPQVAVISVGQNLFGHPHQEVIDNLNNNDCKLYRTDQNGTVLITSNGEKCFIRTLR